MKRPMRFAPHRVNQPSKRVELTRKSFDRMAAQDRWAHRQNMMWRAYFMPTFRKGKRKR
jgi:hypothetical protein